MTATVEVARYEADSALEVAWLHAAATLRASPHVVEAELLAGGPRDYLVRIVWRDREAFLDSASGRSYKGALAAFNPDTRYVDPGTHTDGCC